MLRYMLYHVAGGNAFFTGAALLLAVVLWGAIACDRLPKLRSLAAFIALILILLSTTPLPVAFCALWGCSMALWLWKSRARESRRWRAGSAAILSLVTVAAVAAEAWTILRPSPPLPPGAGLAVIGDSLSAVESLSRPNWPEFLAAAGHSVTNLAGPGANAGDAIEQAERIPDGASAVIVFIGGNDLLGGTSATAFEARLDRLLTAASQPGRTLYLIELPLVPLFYRYGAAQRRQAREHGAILISKRVVAGVLSREDATSDGLHLSEQGSRRLAAAIARQLGILL